MDEFELIERYLVPLAKGEPAALALRDDAAVLPQRSGLDLVLTKDAMVEGVHFLESDPPQRIGSKLLRVNLSDLAAMGAEPEGYLLATAWSPRVTAEWIGAFASGLAADNDRYGVYLLGGDTVSTDGPLTLSLTAVGHVPEGRALLRSGAGEGDEILVTGTIGDAALGLAVLSGQVSRELVADSGAAVDAYQLPTPPVPFGPSLIGIASSAIDISDGLIADLGHVCEESSLKAEILTRDLPLSKVVRSALDAGLIALEDILAGGDDYQLLFTAPSEDVEGAMNTAREAGVPLARIGRMVSGKGVLVDGADSHDLVTGAGGFRHRVPGNRQGV